MINSLNLLDTLTACISIIILIFCIFGISLVLHYLSPKQYTCDRSWPIFIYLWPYLNMIITLAYLVYFAMLICSIWTFMSVLFWINLYCDQQSQFLLHSEMCALVLLFWHFVVLLYLWHWFICQPNNLLVTYIDQSFVYCQI